MNEEINERVAILSLYPYSKKTANFIKKEYGKEYLELYHKYLKMDAEYTQKFNELKAKL